MIDLHCHLLPGIDDGPASMDLALELAKQAVEDGVRYSMLTPHIHFGRWENTLGSISRSVKVFQQAMIDAGIPLRSTRDKTFTPTFADINNDGWLDLLMIIDNGNTRKSKHRICLF